MTCPETEPCLVYLELSSVGSAGGKVFVAGNIHSAQGTLYSILLRSDDGGATWREPMGRVRGESLDRIEFENSETGWVSGERVVPLAGDPFFLVTGDGGETWRKVPVLPEGSAGFIQKFHFDSATTGRLVLEGGDRANLLYETNDGAKFWSLAQSGATPVPVEDRVWRIRAEKSGKTFAVERASGGRWTVAASFAIQIAQCKE